MLHTHTTRLMMIVLYVLISSYFRMYLSRSFFERPSLEEMLMYVTRILYIFSIELDRRIRTGIKTQITK